MDVGFYKHAWGIKHKAAMPFYHRKPAQVAPAAAPPAQQAVSKAKPPSTTTLWAMPSPPPSTVVAMEAAGNGEAPGDIDVDRRAALYISRVQERLRRERLADDWRMY
ncbi:hypothetical protein BS78_06G068200 [Paspalum vaginatum]|nr:hypothetical protein BS78_06G068200 [Paspalum vaginatum]